MYIAILGFGREGRSLLKFFKKSPKYRDAKIEILDRKSNNKYLQNLERFDIIFRSPGVPYNLPEIQRAIKNGVKFSSATKLFFDLCPASVIGITGTKGKGTTATILYQIFKKWTSSHHSHHSSRFSHCFLAGNIGKPAIDIFPKLNKKSLAILELSSFQLQDLKKSPGIAVIVDTFPDHLDAHKNIKEYLESKANIVKHQKKSDIVFYFQDNDWASKIASRSSGKKIGISGSSFGLRKNQTMAAAVAAYLGVPPAIINKTIRSFRGLRHRMELVREINSIQFINDSASTNPQTAAAAIQNFPAKGGTPPRAAARLILIAGGKDKNLDYTPLAEAIRQAGNVAAVVLFGENKNKIRNQVSSIKCQVKLCATLKSATIESYKIAKKLINSSTQQLSTILFSPASASFDMFNDYADRGRQFKNLIKKLR